MLLFEGELIEGQNAAVILPTAWEWDGDQRFLAVWNSKVNDWLTRSKDTIARELSRRYRHPFVGSDRALLANPGNPFYFDSVVGTDADRPIGLQPNGPDAAQSFVPQMLILTYEGAQEAARSTSANRGRGVFELRYREPNCCGLEGDYTLFIQVEVVPGQAIVH